jgi:methionyl aminopeptidase
MNQRYKEDFIQAGALAKQVRAYGKTLLVKGASYNDVIQKVHQKIREVGGQPAFPPQMALNHVAAHFLPAPGQDIIFSNELIKLDMGVCYNGAIGDCAITVDLSGKYQHLIDAAEAALLAAEKIIRVGLPIRKIGQVIAETVATFGLTTIKNLGGHGLGKYKVHTSPAIPNYDDQSKGIIQPGMTFAVEPFVTNGKGYIYDAGDPTIFSYVTQRPVHFEMALKLLERILPYKNLPFAIHDVLGDDLPQLVKLGLNELVRAGVIQGYAPLIEEASGMVAQAENSVLIDEKGKIFITTR